MSVPAWFDSQVYFENKLASLGAGWDSLALKQAFESSGYKTDAEGLYQHFVDFGNREGISPNAYFVDSEYLYNKAVDYYPAGTTITANHVESMRQALEGAHLSPWEHYQLYGFAEGISPSVNFDGTAYMKAKLAQLQATEAAANWTMDKLEQAFVDQGYTALTHYYDWGITENLNFKPGTPGTTGVTKQLTTGTDAIYGSAGNDHFSAELGTLNSADYIDGLGGNADVLYAQVDAGNTATRATISNVEKIVFTAQGNVTTDTGSNNVSMSHSYVADDWNVAFDADRVTGSAYKDTGRQVFENKDSRADFAIEDIRVNSNQTIISFANADSGDVDYGVFFDDQHLKSDASSTTGRLSLRLMDVKNADPAFDGTSNPLTENYFDGFTFAYIPDGSTTHQYIRLQFRAADAALYNGDTATYATLLTAFQNALADWETNNPTLAGKFNFTLGAPFDADATVGSITWQGTGSIIDLTSTDGAISAETQTYNEAGWKVSSGNIPSNVRIVAEADSIASTDCPLIQTEVWLDNVGRVQWNDSSPECLPADAIFGSEAGDLVIGGMSKYTGVERFDVKVDQGSWLSTLSSTNNKLRMVTVENVDTNEDGVNGNLRPLANNENDQYGQLFIGDSLFKEDGNLKDWADPLASYVYGATKNNIASWIDLPKLLSTDGLVDVKWFDGSKFQGSLNIGAQITEQSYGKYLADVDDVRNVDASYAPSGEFRYELGSAADVLNMTVNGGIAADQDFKLLINGNDGNDFVNFSFSNLTQNQRSNIINGTVNEGHERVIISGGNGNDVVKVWGDGSITVNGGAGNDAIYVGQNGADQNAVFLFNLSGPASATNVLERAILVDAVDGAQPLDNNILGIGDSDFVVARTATAQTISVRVDFKGIVATYQLFDLAAGTGNQTVTAEQVNAAIAAAIANNNYLQDLLVAKDGAGHSLMIESLVDGVMDVTDLNISFTTNATTNPAVLAGLNTAYGTNEAMATYAVDVLDTANPVHHLDGTYMQFEYYGLNMSEAVQDAYYAIKIGDETYFTATSTGGTTDTDLVTALNAAVDANGNAFSDKYTAIDVTKTIDWTGTTGVDDQGITIHFNSVGDKANVDVELVRLSDEVTGTNTGTTSYNIVDAGPGNDTLILNVNSSAGSATVPLYDVVKISDTPSIGNDVVVNFDSAVDRFLVDSSLGNINVGLDAGGAVLASVAVSNNSANWTAANWTAVLGAINTDGSFVANGDGVGYFHSGGNTYTFFQVDNDATAAVVQSEVTILGTMTFDGDQGANIDVAGTGMFI